MITSIISFPDISEVMSTTRAYASGYFADLVIPVLAIAGLIIGGLFARALLKGVINGVKQLTGSKKKGGGKKK